MKIIHTSDWHLGCSLRGRKRYEESAAFLDWLGDLLEKEKIDVLLIAGDIFDTTTPSNRAQELYYRFLCRAADSFCRHVVITAGNHDSPTFLNAPRELLRHLQVYIVGKISDNLDDEILLLQDDKGEAELIVAAVPYLRDRDIRKVEEGESPEDKTSKLVEGIGKHYEEVARRAEEIRATLPEKVPVIAMGHLFAAGGSTVEGDGVRELYVGSLAQVGHEFPSVFAYIALGHLHSPQMVGGKENCRYSGAPIPMGFAEAQREKQVLLVEFCDEQMEVRPIKVPLFKALHSIRGKQEEIEQQLRGLISCPQKAWLEIIYEGEKIIGDLRERIEEKIAGTGLELLRLSDNRYWNNLISSGEKGESLNELEHSEVFRRCLETYGVEQKQRQELLQMYREITNSLLMEDRLAE